MRNVLVVSSVPEVPPEVHAKLRDEDVGKIHVVAPAVKQSRLQWLTNAEDDARAEAEQTAAKVAQETAGEAFVVRLAVTGEDRRGLYADIMEAISQTGTNIRGADLHTKDGTVFGTIFVEVDNLPHLGKVMKAVRRVKGVTEIDRREAPPN